MKEVEGNVRERGMTRCKREKNISVKENENRLYE